MIWLARAHLTYLVRERSVLATALLTGAAVGLVGLLSLHDASERALAAGAILWLVASIGGLVALARVLSAEEGGGGLEGLLLGPLTRRDLFLARTLAAWPLVLVLALASWGVLALLFPDLAHLRTVAPLPGVLVGTLGLTIVGSLSAWAALGSRGGELLGPVLAVPLAAPLLISSIHATSVALATGEWLDPSLTFGLGYDLAVGALSYIVAAFVVEVGP